MGHNDGIGRRQLLAGTGGAAALLAIDAVIPERAMAEHRGAGLIDVHHHIRPPGAPEGFARLTAGWTPQGAIAEMDRSGVATGIAYPGPILAHVEAKADLARRFNEFGAGLMRAHPTRFGLFASLPLPDVNATLAELTYSYDQLRADGVGVSTSYGDHWLGDRRFWPVYEALDKREAVVFVHPHDAACCASASMTYLEPSMDGSWIDWPMNTARTIFSLITSGTIRRFPRIRWIFAHGGGVMPLLIERLANFENWSAVGPDRLSQLYPNGIAAEFRTLYFECAQAWAKPNLGALRALVPDSHILFGSDYPFFSMELGARSLARAGLPRKSVKAVGRGNAQSLLKRWA